MIHAAMLPLLPGGIGGHGLGHSRTASVPRLMVREPELRGDLVREIHERSSVLLRMIAGSHVQRVVYRLVQQRVGDELAILIERARMGEDDVHRRRSTATTT